MICRSSEANFVETLSLKLVNLHGNHTSSLVENDLIPSTFCYSTNPLVSHIPKVCTQVPGTYSKSRVVTLH